MIGRLHHVVIDCARPRELAEFYSELTGLPVTYERPDWVVISEDEESSGLAFQLTADFQPPKWPNPDYPQQIHLDVMVDDFDEAEQKVLALGAHRLTNTDSAQDWRVYADPEGHPFCLVPRPGWAAPVHAEEG